MEETIAALANEMADATDVVALTGAGVSTASGVPSFRGDGGIWEQFDQRDFHFRRFEADPAGFWCDRLDLRETFYGDRKIEPNAAHEALANLEARGHLDALLTQNVDGLHQAAGSETVIELHGTNREVACVDCGHREQADPVFERARDGDLPPTCPDCGGTLQLLNLPHARLLDECLRAAPVRFPAIVPGLFRGEAAHLSLLAVQRHYWPSRSLLWWYREMSPPVLEGSPLTACPQRRRGEVPAGIH